MFGVPLGGALSYAFSGPLAQAWGWRAAMALAAAPALLLVPALLLTAEPARTPHLHGPGEKLRIRSAPLIWIIASGAVLNFGLYAFSTFLPAFMTRVHGLSLAHAGLWTGLGYGVAGISGGAAGGAAGDWRPQKRLIIAALACLAAAPWAVLGILQPRGSAMWALAALLAAYALLSSYYALVYAAIQDLVPPNAVARTMALYFLAMYLCGAAFGPFLTGTLSDSLAARALASGAAAEAARAKGLQQAMLVIPVLSVAIAVTLFAAARSSDDRMSPPMTR
jgi:predicted MFS family arabinose efflux permease